MNPAALIAVTITILAMATAAHGEDADIAAIFHEKHIEGTLVISSLDGQQAYTHNDERARMRFVPADTFDLPNILIALEEEVVGGEEEIVVWDGTDKGSPVCESDQTIVTAYSASCIWFYQEMAKRVGKDKYSTYVEKIRYGNGRSGPELTDFWMEGDLRISAMGQIDFLKNVYTRTYPFRASAYDLLRKLMVEQETPASTLRAKTGWARTVLPQVGWYVGFVETGGKVWFFATDMEIANPEDRDLPREVTMRALRLKGIM